MKKLSVRQVLLEESIIFNLHGYKVEINIWFFIALCLVLIIDTDSGFAWCLLAATIHEYGHIWAMKILGCRNCTIRLSGFGIKLIRKEGIFGSNFQEIICSLAGPLVNFLCFALLYAIGKAFSVWEHIIPFAQMNLALGLFNILPIFPLDGGKIVAVMLSMFCSDGQSLKFSELISALFLMPIATIGILVAIKTKYNFSLLILVVYLMAFLAIKKR